MQEVYRFASKKCIKISKHYDIIWCITKKDNMFTLWEKESRDPEGQRFPVSYPMVYKVTSEE